MLNLEHYNVLVVKLLYFHLFDNMVKGNCEEYEKGMMVSTCIRKKEITVLKSINCLNRCQRTTYRTDQLHQNPFYDTRPKLSIDFAENTGPNILKEELIHDI